MTFINQKTDPDDFSYLEHCTDGNVSGLCIICADYDSPRIRSLIGSDIPCVTVDHMFRRIPAVLSDNETGVRKLVEYAIQKGHRRIAYIHEQNNSLVTCTRISQFSSVMDFYHLPVPPEYIKEGVYNDIQLTRSLVLDLLALPDRPTCILLPDDFAYLGAQEAAMQLGLSIPGDIPFGGYDGIPLTQALEPRLTTIRQSTDQMGATAAQRLMNLIEHPIPMDKRPVIFPVELIEGETIGSVVG